MLRIKSFRLAVLAAPILLGVMGLVGFRLLDLQGVNAQQAIVNDGPIQISNTTGEIGVDTLAVSFDLTNTSANLIQGYVVAVDFFSPSGKLLSRSSRTIITGLEPPPAPTGYVPGKRWREGVVGRALTESPASITSKVYLDYVVYEDGHSWGEDILGQSKHIAGVKSGFRTATARMKNLVKQKGVQVLVEELNRSNN